MALVLAASACDDNPLAEDRDKAAYFRLNPVNTAVNIGGTITVEAVVLNKYGAATNESVSATPCDAKITAAPDPQRSDFEYPEKFVVTGVTFGTTCLVVNGGGITDTIDIRVVPAELDLELSAPGDTLLESGDQITLPLAFLSATGTAIPGLGLDDRTTFTVATAAIGIIDEDGTFTARAPGSTWIRASFTDLGVTRRDSVFVTVVAAPFTGNAVQTTWNGLQAIEFTAGAIPFDDNTTVEFVGVPNPYLIDKTATTIRVLVPTSVGADSTFTFRILQAGPTEATVEDEFTTTASGAEPFNNTSMANARPLAIGEEAWGIIPGVRGQADWFVVTVTQAGTYRISFRWYDNQDKDAYVMDSTGTALLSLENAATANPETGTIALTPGTYYLRGETWTPNPGPEVPYTMTFTLEN